MVEAKDSSGKTVFICTEEEIEEMIKKRAYFIALERGFFPGYELQDWLIAEKETYDEINELYLEGENIESK